MNDIFSLSFLNSEIIAQRFIYFPISFFSGNSSSIRFSDENYPYLYRELLQRLSGCLVRRGLPPGNILPMIPAYPDGQPTARPACRFPSRKHSWRPLRGTRYFSNGAAGSPFLPGSVRHERNRQIFRLVAGRELPLLSVSGSGYRR